MRDLVSACAVARVRGDDGEETLVLDPSASEEGRASGSVVVACACAAGGGDAGCGDGSLGLRRVGDGDAAVRERVRARGSEDARGAEGGERGGRGDGGDGRVAWERGGVTVGRRTRQRVQAT